MSIYVPKESCEILKEIVRYRSKSAGKTKKFDKNINNKAIFLSQ